MKRFLCICEGGNVRSVALAFVLKNFHNRDALACGWRFTELATLKMLCKWAEAIVLMQREFIDKVPKKYHKDLLIVDVGPDRYGTPFHPELHEFLKNVAEDWEKKGWFE
jgi:predicted protein tyrosine phosphatase